MAFLIAGPDELPSVPQLVGDMLAACDGLWAQLPDDDGMAPPVVADTSSRPRRAPLAVVHPTVKALVNANHELKVLRRDFVGWASARVRPPLSPEDVYAPDEGAPAREWLVSWAGAAAAAELWAQQEATSTVPGARQPLRRAKREWAQHRDGLAPPAVASWNGIAQQWAAVYGRAEQLVAATQVADTSPWVPERVPVTFT